MSEKAKTDKPAQQRINRYGFLALWIAGQVIGWLLLILVLESDIGSRLNTIPLSGNWLFALNVAIFVGIPTILAQKLALFLGFGRGFKGWARVNLIAWFLGSFIFAALLEADRTGNERLDLTLQILVLMLLPTIAQAWIFSRYIQRIWLWLASSLVASTVSAALAQSFIDGSYTGIFVAFGSYAMVTGLTLLWLFGMQATENQLKTEADTSRLEDSADDEVENEALEKSSEVEQVQ
jgi:hypothetical protein